eukprot:4165582-Pyramimonas_sp.AAC.1
MRRRRRRRREEEEEEEEEEEKGIWNLSGHPPFEQKFVGPQAVLRGPQLSLLWGLQLELRGLLGNYLPESRVACRSVEGEVGGDPFELCQHLAGGGGGALRSPSSLPPSLLPSPPP